MKPKNDATENLFDIKHHSPSTLSNFIERRYEWYLKKIRGISFPGSHPMARGKAVEEGINHYLRAGDSVTITECVQAGIDEWAKEILSLGENFDMRQSIGPCIVAGIESFRQRGYDDGQTQLQEKISIVLDGCSLPTIGYLDYLRKDRVIDNKCVSKTPTFDKVTNLYKQKQGYVIQAAVYEAATGRPPFFHYVIPLKTEVKIVEARFSNEELDWGLKLATKAAQAIETIISNPIDGALFEAMVFPNPDQLYEGAQQSIVLKEFKL